MGSATPKTAVQSLSSDRRGFSWLSVTALTSLIGFAAGAAWYLMPTDEDQETPFEYVVQRGDFVHEITERGEVESSSNIDVKCMVQSLGTQGTTILEIIDEGAYVKQGDVLAKLDSSALEAELLQQEIICSNSDAAVTQARNIYETALIAKQEYIDGTYKQEKELIEGEVFVAREALRKAQDYAEFGKELAREGLLTEDALEADKFAVEKAQKDLSAALTKLNVLTTLTLEKMTKTFDADIQTTNKQLEAAEKTYELDLDKLALIKDQIEKCTVVAPSDGQVVYANESDRRGNVEVLIELGVAVKENQVMFRLPDPNQMQVRAKVNETRIAAVKVGMPATIRLDAHRNELLYGEVTAVGNAALPARWSASNVKEYATYVRIENPPANLRTGFTAEVRILVQRLPDVLQVPVQAIKQIDKLHYCLVKPPAGGGLIQREVTLGPTNDKFVVIERGLEEGEVVILNPSKFLKTQDTPEEAEDFADKKASRYEQESAEGPRADASNGEASGSGTSAAGAAE